MGTRTWGDMRGDTFDSREVIERIAELELLLGNDDDEQPDGTLDVEREELAALRAIAKDGESAPDWQYGETFIPDAEFEDYARELAEDIGAIPSDYSWPASHIDWTAAADALRQDYTSYTFDGIDYLAR